MMTPRLPHHLRLIKLTRLPKNKDAQVELTVREMIKIACVETWSPDVRWLATHARLPHYSHAEKAQAFCRFIRAQFPFELDPDDIELIRTPSYYARELRAGRRRGGDCDDLSLLLATMLSAEGFDRLAFVVMATSPGSQSSGTAAGRRSEPAAATMALMSARPSRWLPGTTQSPLAALQPYS